MCISGKPLLLAAGRGLTGNIHVSHVATTSVTCTTSIIVLEELEVTVDLNSSERTSLGNSPKHWGSSSWCDHHIFSTSPKVVECTDFEVEVTILDHQISKNGVVRSTAQTVDGGIVADLHVDRAMIAWFE